MKNPSTFKLPKRLDNIPDWRIIQHFRTWEKLEKKIAAYRNHLHFALHCKHHDVIPNSLKLKCAMKGRNAQRIIERAQKALLNERVSEINTKLLEMEAKRAESDEFLFTHCSNGTYTEIKDWTTHARNKTFVNFRDRQQKKFERLYAKHVEKNNAVNGPIVDVSDEEKERIKSKWIVNLSDRVLTSDEECLFKKGLNFAVTPDKIPTEEYIIGIESACRLIGPNTKEAETLRSDCVRILKNAPPPKPNLKRKEKIALGSLARDSEITIVPADKGRAVVVLNTKDYKTKARALLDDTNSLRTRN